MRTTQTQLTPAQHAILAKAINTSSGKIEWFPDNVKGGARKKVLDGLFKRALITSCGEDWFVAAEGYDALGMPRPGVRHATPATGKRANSKQADFIRMLQRPEGATVPELCAATGWLPHTVRGTFSNVVKKKLGLTLVSEKPQGGVRVYRVA